MSTGLHQACIRLHHRSKSWIRFYDRFDLRADVQMRYKRTVMKTYSIAFLLFCALPAIAQQPETNPYRRVKIAAPSLEPFAYGNKQLPEHWDQTKAIFPPSPGMLHGIATGPLRPSS